MPESHDVVIVGAGPAGSALAYFLASSGISVQLVDKSDFPRDKTCGDGLSPRALRVLQHMGLLDPARAAGFEIRRVAFFAPDGNQVVVPIPVREQLPDFALVLPRYRLDDMLRERAVAAGANFRPQARVTGALRCDGLVTGVHADTPTGPLDLPARFTVFATGASYATLERANLLAHRPDFSRATRAYYQGVHGLSDTIEFHYNSVPLPGYGWVFPTSATSANIGAGYYAPPGHPDTKTSPRQVFDGFVANPRTARMLADARATSPVKGYPLRFDFPASRVAFPGLALVGEACGLVNPLTGEGIDYALESAEMAAEVLLQAVRQGEAPQQTMRRYSAALRGRFLPTYRSLIRVRDIYLRPWTMNRYIAAAQRNDELASLLVNIGLGNVDPLRAFSIKNLLQIALG